ncbi:MAG: hypothetical protein AAFS11_10995, partial [Planctomycetota bacterium]
MTTAARQTVALFIDAYRELAAGKLFWITLVLSAVVAAAFAAVGIDEEGFTALWFRLDFIPVTSETLPPSALYKFLFFQLGMGIWLTWIATILGLVTTAGIIPSLISSGVIDSMVAKPISRTRLFLTRYSTGLLFAALQVLLFSTAAFLVLGIRGGEWLPAVFLAVPIVVVFYSYLFAIMALLGLVTRSTIASLLLTLLMWFVLFIVNAVDASLVGFDTQSKIRIETLEARIAEVEGNTAQTIIRQKVNAGEAVADDYQPTADEINEANPFINLMRGRLERAQETQAKLDPWVTGTYIVKTVLPKTGETIALLERFIISEEEGQALIRAFAGESEPEPSTINEDTGRQKRTYELAVRRLNGRLGCAPDHKPYIVVVDDTLQLRLA